MESIGNFINGFTYKRFSEKVSWNVLLKIMWISFFKTCWKCSLKKKSYEGVRLGGSFGHLNQVGYVDLLSFVVKVNIKC
jgi:hypothetical protein